jgi:two-component system KDP operon response regulator KdpE
MRKRAAQLLRKLWPGKPEESFTRRAADREIITIGDFRINMETRSVTVRGRALQLSDAEFELLVFLADHPKQLVTPQTMLSTRWPGRGARQRQFIRVLMSLREKLDAEGPAKHYIRTEPWIFYRFDPNAF